ncbi:MAG: hypothetical protein H7338_16700 [Candidatus Sericytochromatia bacterium]|nr:hypothetical protein [Candidatus Sericytochromatia bacterium]
MIPHQMDRILMWVAAAHLFMGMACMLALLMPATPILGVHPALKPMKFGLSIGIFLASMALIVPALSIPAPLRHGVVWALSLTMIVEMAAILIQAIRGTTSHFNLQGVFNTAVWQVMAAAIGLATLGAVGIALVATCGPLMAADGTAMHPLVTAGWRAGLWLSLLAAISGFGMGGRLRHSVGGDDGGPGLPLLNWSTSHGDLRVSHFLALHALQILPLVSIWLAWSPLANVMRWTVLGLAVGIYAIVTVWTLLQAIAARPIWS